MRVTYEPFENIEDSLYVKIIGAWQPHDMVEIAENIVEIRPTILVVDTSQTMLSSEQDVPIEESDDRRRTAIQMMLDLMADNPDMLYVIITPNDSSVVKSAKPLYEARGMGDRYLFATDTAEALRLVKAHQASLDQDT